MISGTGKLIRSTSTSFGWHPAVGAVRLLQPRAFAALGDDTGVCGIAVKGAVGITIPLVMVAGISGGLQRIGVAVALLDFAGVIKRENGGADNIYFQVIALVCMQAAAGVIQ